MDEITCPQGHADQGAEGAKSRNQYISLCFPQRAWNLAAAILSSWSSALTERHGGSWYNSSTCPPGLYRLPGWTQGYWCQGRGQARASSQQQRQPGQVWMAFAFLWALSPSESGPSAFHPPFFFFPQQFSHAPKRYVLLWVPWNVSDPFAWMTSSHCCQQCSDIWGKGQIHFMAEEVSTQKFQGRGEKTALSGLQGLLGATLSSSHRPCH